MLFCAKAAPPTVFFGGRRRGKGLVFIAVYGITALSAADGFFKRLSESKIMNEIHKLTACAEDGDAIVIAAFGSTHVPTRAAYAALEGSVRAAFPHCAVSWAYTSPTVRKKLSAKGEEVCDALETLARLAAVGVQRVAVLSAHIMPGDEFHRLCVACAEGGPARPAHIEVAAPLFAGNDDLAALAEGLVLEEAPLLAAKEGVLLVGHGTAHGAGMVYPALQYFLGRLCPDFFVCALEGEPTLDEALRAAKARGLKRLRLAPLMTVAGEHIASDVLGEGEESIVNRAAAVGFACAASWLGLAERPCAQKIWLAHLAEAMARLDRHSQRGQA